MVRCAAQMEHPAIFSYKDVYKRQIWSGFGKGMWRERPIY